MFISEELLQKLFSLDVEAGAPEFMVYSQQHTNRLEYTLEFIFNHVLKINYTVVTDRKKFENEKGFKLNYSSGEIPGSLQIIPHGLLFEKGVSHIVPEAGIKDGMLYFFSSEKGFHFDVFSAVFYMISRCEEWRPFTADQHGRFELKESILFKNNFHLVPVVDHWIRELAEALEKNASVKIPGRKFEVMATIDVDNLFAYKHKGFLRTLGAGFKDLLRFDFANIMRRNAVITNTDPDPFDIYESFSAFCKQKNIRLFFFFLFRHNTKYDRTVNPSSKAFDTVMKTVTGNNAQTGLHPSYYAEEKNNLVQEVKSFSKRFGKVGFSRQHYLRFGIKTTPQLLMDNGIVADFSMGFASGAGFRAGTSIPFYYYNFTEEKKEFLMLVPFCAMDGAYFIYNTVSANEAKIALEKLKDEVKKVNGLFITVFHERTFAEHLYPGFGEMYKALLLT